MPNCCRGTDDVKTGHGCDAKTTIDAPKTTGQAKNVFANGLPIACLGNVTVVHLIPSGDSCAPHVAVINISSSNVFVGGIGVARLGDSTDAGKMIQGSPSVFVNG